MLYVGRYDFEQRKSIKHNQDVALELSIALKITGEKQCLITTKCRAKNAHRLEIYSQ